jgi:SSS family transporter
VSPSGLTGVDLLPPILVSLVVVVAIGFWSLRRTRSHRDFFVAGQRVGLWATGLGTMAAAFSGFVFLGGPGLAYRMGIASLAIVLPVSFTAGLLCWSLARRLRLLAEVREVFTIPDAISCRFEDSRTTALSIVAVLIGVIGYLGAQFLALGVLFESLLPLPESLGSWRLPIALLAGGCIVLLYSAMGGMVAGVYTDVLQGILMLVAALTVFARVLWVGGGPGQIVASVAQSQTFEGFFDPVAEGMALTTLGFFLVFGIGVLGQPHVLHKFYMMKDPRQLRWIPLILSASQALCLLIWVSVGLTVPALVATGRMAPLVRADDAAPRFLMEFGTPALSGLVVAAVIAAIMSTADSFLNIGSAALVRDVPRLLGRPVSRRLSHARGATVVVAIVAAALALTYDDLIALLGTFAFGTLGAALGPALAVGLSWRRVNSTAATVSIATGLLVSLGLELARQWSPTGSLVEWGLARGVLPAALALMASLSALMVVTWVTGKEEKQSIAAEVRTAMES